MALRSETANRILHHMDKPLIQLTNFIPHPADKRFVIFMFPDMKMAEFFEEELIREKIPYEKELDEENDPERMLFALKRTYTDRAIKINYLAHGKYRQPTFRTPVWRWIVFILVGVFLAFALYGYFSQGE